MRIIPAIDIIDGKCVRLSQGDYTTKKIYNENPLEVAKAFEDHGMQFLHLVDLGGAGAAGTINYKMLESLSSKTKLNIDLGGGIRNEEAIKKAFEYGARQVNIGSASVTSFNLTTSWLKHYGAEKIILGADCSERKIVTHAWTQQTELDVISFIKRYEEQGMLYCVCTDISKDGMLQGPSAELYREITRQTGVRLIASGGVSSLSDLLQLKEIGCEGAIIGKAIYEGRITLKELSQLC